jgi:hypothetical protein
VIKGDFRDRSRFAEDNRRLLTLDDDQLNAVQNYRQTVEFHRGDQLFSEFDINPAAATVEWNIQRGDKITPGL